MRTEPVDEVRVPHFRPEILGCFTDHAHWVFSASRVLTGHVDSNGWPMKLMCVDSRGRRCHNGGDFDRARRENTFPVFYFAEMRVEEPAAPCPTEPVDIGAELPVTTEYVNDRP